MLTNTACKLRLSLTAITVMGLVTSQPVGAQSVARYSITDLGLGAAYGINNQGQVVGRDGTGSDPSFNDKGQVVGGSNGHAFLYSNGEKQDLGTLGGPSSTAYGINDNGQVVGQADISSQTSHAFFWDPNNGMKDLGTLDSYNGPGTFNGFVGSYARSINNRGQIVGASVASVTFNVGSSIYNSQPIPRATLWDHGTVSYLGISFRNGTDESSLPYPVGTTANSINKAGQIVGTAQDWPDPAKNSYAVLWQNGTNTPLGSQTYSIYDSVGNGINNKGQAVGTFTVGPGTVNGPFVKGFILDFNSATGVTTNGNTLEPISSHALSVNNKGQVVGYGFKTIAPPEPNHAFFWDKQGVLIDLNTVIPNNSGWTLNIAYGINKTGQIVGQGQLNGQAHAFLLTPIPQSSPTP